MGDRCPQTTNRKILCVLELGRIDVEDLRGDWVK
jgi:hypothetical protein